MLGRLCRRSPGLPRDLYPTPRPGRRRRRGRWTTGGLQQPLLPGCAHWACARRFCVLHLPRGSGGGGLSQILETVEQRRESDVEVIIDAGAVSCFREENVVCVLWCMFLDLCLGADHLYRRMVTTTSSR